MRDNVTILTSIINRGLIAGTEAFGPLRSASQQLLASRKISKIILFSVFLRTELIKSHPLYSTKTAAADITRNTPRRCRQVP
jgi:hypothetical protein